MSSTNVKTLQKQESITTIATTNIQIQGEISIGKLEDTYFSAFFETFLHLYIILYFEKGRAVNQHHVREQISTQIFSNDGSQRDESFNVPRHLRHDIQFQLIYELRKTEIYTKRCIQHDMQSKYIHNI